MNQKKKIKIVMKKITLVKSLESSFTLILMAVIFLNCTVASAQSTILFQNEEITMPNNIASFNWDSMPTSAKYNNGYFGWAHFSQTPTQDIQDQFAQRNLRLIEYFPDQTYLVYIPENTQISYLQQSGVVSIIPVENNFKKSTDIKLNNIADHAMEGNNIIVMLEYYDFIDKSYVLRELSKINTIAIKKSYNNSNYIEVAIPENQMDAVVSKPFVKWVELIAATPQLLDLRGRSLHRSSNLDTQTPTGRNYTGAGIGLLVRDDGVVGEHIDFQGRLDNQITSNSGTHADGVSGIMTGAGNLDPTTRGMAVGSDFYTTNVFTDNAGLTFTDSPTVTLINSGEVQITNNSYGTGCNDGYDGLGRAVDQQVDANQTVLHVFAAGNSGTADCGYGAGAGWGNIGGGANESKNTITTANTFFNGQLVGSSSRGPAADGRIKPDITAHGQNQISTTENNGYQTFGGTSGASPGIAGVSAQLYEAYTTLNAGALPESALIKATLLNTATDYGNVGPDFSFGWGMINGLRAAMLLEEGRYLDSSISQGGSNDHSITVPANTSEVRFMVYWHDAPAAAAASPALVNDLDLVVTDPGSTTHQPWVLDSTPNAAFLNFPATTGTDRLNNVEQVVISNPAAGTYNVNIAGFNVPMGPQKYYVVYEIITDGITLTYPIGGEKLIAGAQTLVHWDSQNAVNNTQIELSEDNGATWTNLVTLPPASRNYTWNVPNDLVSGECMLRITNGTFTDQSATFSSARRVSGVGVTQVCPDGATIIWAGISGATSYDVYVLGEKYMEVAATVTVNSIVLPLPDPTDPLWVSVVAKGGNGWESLRSNAVTVNQGNGGLFNCPLVKDLAVTTINNTESDFDILCNTNPIIISADLDNGGTDAQSNFTVSYQIGSEAIVSETYTASLAAGASDTYAFTTPATLTTNGNTTLRVWTSLVGDEFVNNDERTFDFVALVTGTDLNFVEDFEVASVFPQGWNITNFDNSITWTSATNITGIDGNPTQSIFVDAYNYNGAVGQQDWLVTEYVNLTAVPDASLKFDLAKAQYDATNQDDLRIDISTDCGATFTQIYFKDGSDLATVPNTTSLWAPTAGSDWRTETIDLAAYLGNNVLFRFAHVNGVGNSMYIDNIKVESSILSIDENTLESAISMYPNPAKSNVDIVINTTIGNTYEIELLNSIGQTITKTEETRFNARAQQKLDVSKYGTGLYFVKITVGNQTVTKKLIVN